MNLESDSAPRNVSSAVVNRLSLYLRELQHLMVNDVQTISSTKLGKLLGLKDAQVRKDLANFGHLGYPGVGYRCHELANAIKQILGTDQSWPVALVGAGNLGQALLGHRGFAEQGFDIVAAFDVAAENVGEAIGNVPVFHTDDLAPKFRQFQIRLAILAVPAVAAQEVADKLVKAGVEGILNFAPVTISLPDSVRLVGVDLAIQLEQLLFAVVNRR